MLSLLTLLLGLLNPSGSPDAVPLSQTSEFSAVNAHYQSGQWTQSFQALEHQTRDPEELRVTTSFQTLNGVSLDWSSRELIEAKGEPQAITYDEITGYTEYHYPEVTAGLYDDTVYYVHADKHQGGINVNGRFIPLTSYGLNLFLGKPFYQAEDGDVYTRQEKVLKIYSDAAGNRTGADLFDDVIS